MKVAILIFDGGKQIMFTPENDMERQALSLVTAEDDIHTVIKRGTFTDTKGVLGFDTYETNGGYYRAGESEESVMFVLTPKEKQMINSVGKYAYIPVDGDGSMITKE